MSKLKQLEIILQNNPADDGIHTWIRSEEDIKDFQETLLNADDIITTPDYTEEMIEQALQTGKITVYSSYQIGQGVFVTPSKMEAESYAGGNNVYSKEVNLEDIAWIDNLEGQYANIREFELDLDEER